MRYSGMILTIDYHLDYNIHNMTVNPLFLKILGESVRS